MGDALGIYLISLIISLVISCVFGLITKAINENKGYYGGFAWGFFLGWIGILVVALRQAPYYASTESIIVSKQDGLPSQAITSQPTDSGSWKCSCGRCNADYMRTCVCGMQKRDVLLGVAAPDIPKEEANNIALLKQYKALLDSGVLTQEEFEAKKKSILSK